MQYTIEELRHKVFEKVYDVYEIFKNHFGEQFVDLQGLPDDSLLVDLLELHLNREVSIETDFPIEISDDLIGELRDACNIYKAEIIVWWPRVTVTNDNDKSIEIQDLYAKVKLDIEGRIPYEYSGFKLTRSTYNSIQFQSGYTHSHVPGFSPSSSVADATRWMDPCLGSGPIRHTIMDLKNNNEEALWMLFCEELARYVTVESLRGGPYKRLEEVGSRERLIDYTGFAGHTIGLNSIKRYSSCYYPSEELISDLKDFTVYYLQHGHLCFNYQDEAFKIGMSFFNFIIDISNTYIEWFNKKGTAHLRDELFTKGILVNSCVAEGKFYTTQRASTVDTARFEGSPVLKFKGRDIVFHIDNVQDVEPETTILLSYDIAMYILQNILKIINYRYKNEHTNTTRGDSTTIAPTYQTVIYL